MLLFACAGLALSPSAAREPAAAGERLAQQPGVAAPGAAREGFTAALDDLWLGAAVKARLLRSREVSGFDVEVEARAGVVTLFGMVPTLAAQAAAELAAVKLPGVRRVENWVEVVPAPEQARVREHDRELQRSIRARLAEEPRLAGHGVDVALCNRVARLRGSLDGPEAHAAVLDTVQATAGVRRVVDRLTIRGGGAQPL